MALTKRQKLFVHEFVSHPGRDPKESTKAAGYSKRRISETTSGLMRHTEVQAEIQKLLDQKLEAVPTRESVFKCINEVRESARRAGDCQWANNALLKCAELEMKALGMFAEQPAPPVTEVDARNIAVNFIEPDQAARLNASAAQFERRLSLDEGSMGRLPAAHPEAAPEILPPPKREAMRLEISEDERQRLMRVAMPMGGAITMRGCVQHGSFEAVWQQGPGGWGWSGCPQCEPGPPVLSARMQ